MKYEKSTETRDIVTTEALFEAETFLIQSEQNHNIRTIS